MPRNGAGVYSLPPSNPVIPFTTIATAWANPTMQDIADALTDSLSRTGLGGMLAPFRIADGTLPAPGLAFTDETGLGIRRPSLGIMSFVNGGADVFQILDDRASAVLPLEFKDIVSLKKSGFVSWRIMNFDGVLLFTPSATPDNEDWDFGASWGANPNGQVEMGNGLVVLGTFESNDAHLDNATFTGVTTVSGIMNSSDVITADRFVANKYTINLHTSVGDTAINFALGQSQLFNLAAPLTITSIAGLVAGNIGRITFTGTVNAVTWPSSVKWPGPTFAQPNLAAGPLDIAVVVLEYDGTNYFANASVY